MNINCLSRILPKLFIVVLVLALLLPASPVSGAVDLAIPAVIPAQAVARPTDWTRQFGGTGEEYGLATAVDAAGNIYATGCTSGALPGQTSSGGVDAFVRKYDAGGTQVWTRQFGTPGDEVAAGISVDALGVYVVGYTSGTLPGQTSSGGYDAFVRKYDAAGTEVWTRQIPTREGEATGVSAGPSGVYVAGYTWYALSGQPRFGFNDAFVRKYDAGGTEIWTRQFGTPGTDAANGIAVDASGIYVIGETTGAIGQSFGSMDVFVRKYDAAGTEVWTRQFGTESADYGYGVTADASGTYVVGATLATLPGQTSSGGYCDAFVRKYNADGTDGWTRQFGTSGEDVARGVSVKASGIYVAGVTQEALPGQTSSGSHDAFVIKYDAGGTQAWAHQFGTPGLDVARGISVDASINIIGDTDGILPGQDSSGSRDAFLVNLPVNVAPDITSLTTPTGPVPVTTPVSVSAKFSDPDIPDSHTATWDWGDGTTSAGGINEETGSVSGNHLYSAPGVYTVELTVADQYGASNTVNCEPNFVVVYDAHGSFVTGGGWIDSPAGASSVFPEAIGKANFGFVSKYQKGANVPTGNTEFQFKAGDLNFKSSSYEWLVVAGSKAQFKGVGTINGAGTYKFMLFAGDNSPDTFRIKITDESDVTVYDNGSEQAISGGSIVIHK